MVIDTWEARIKRAREASEVLDTSIKRIMRERNLNYQDAFMVVQREKPKLVEKWSSIQRRAMFNKISVARGR